MPKCTNSDPDFLNTELTGISICRNHNALSPSPKPKKLRNKVKMMLFITTSELLSCASHKRPICQQATLCDVFMMQFSGKRLDMCKSHKCQCMKTIPPSHLQFVMSNPKFLSQTQNSSCLPGSLLQTTLVISGVPQTGNIFKRLPQFDSLEDLMTNTTAQLVAIPY